MSRLIKTIPNPLLNSSSGRAASTHALLALPDASDDGANITTSNGPGPKSWAAGSYSMSRVKCLRRTQLRATTI
jgi:hypothetical protein